MSPTFLPEQADARRQSGQCMCNVRRVFIVQTKMPLPALPHAREVCLTRLHERGSDWLCIFSNFAEHKKNIILNICERVS